MHVTSLIYIMVAYKVNISTTIYFFISIMEDPMDLSVLCLNSYMSFIIQPFSTIKNLTIELVDST